MTNSTSIRIDSNEGAQPLIRFFSNGYQVISKIRLNRASGQITYKAVNTQTQ